jgi:hypothetical protein
MPCQNPFSADNERQGLFCILYSSGTKTPASLSLIQIADLSPWAATSSNITRTQFSF